MNKVLLFLLCVVIIIGIIACDGVVDPMEEEGPLFVLIIDKEGLQEEGSNALALKGFERAKEEFGIRFEIVTPNSFEEYLPSVKIAAAKGAALIVCNGASMAEAVQVAAAEFPDQAFAIIDGDVDAPNVSTYTFTEEGGAFLAGVAAATMSKTHIIGFVWDSQNPVTEKFQYGFEAGVESAGADSQVLINYTNFPGEELLCKETALAQNKLGVDVIFHGGGGCAEGVCQAAEEQGFWLIGMDKAQAILYPESLLCAVVKSFDLAAYMAVENYENGVANGAKYNFSLGDGGVALLDIQGNLTEEASLTVNKWKQKIIDNEIVVPYDAATFAEFFLE